jgi:hypothetical protein
MSDTNERHWQRPGGQPHNRIAASFQEQFGRMFKLREPPALDRAVEERVRFIIRAELAEFVRQLPELVRTVLRAS